MIHIKNAHVYAPEDLRICDIIVAGEKMIYVGKPCKISMPVEVEEVDLAGHIVGPGLIDQHVHITGGGGEGGFETSTPEITISEIVRAGITTVIGCLGTDSLTRSVERLYAKAKALESEGISTYIFTGAYQFPLPTITGDIRSDIAFIDKVVGVGEVAISDHRSSEPEPRELAQLAARARVAAMTGKKGGKVHLHVGDAPAGISPILRIVSETNIPIGQFQPTHLNRNKALLESSFEFGKAGGYCDYTAFEETDGPDEKASRAVAEALRRGVSLDRLTVSSDGNGSMPVFDSHGNYMGLTVAPVSSLFESFRALVSRENIPLEAAFTVFSANQAAIHKLPWKGKLAPGYDADLVVLDNDLNVRHVLARGKWAVKDGKVVMQGTFERSV